MILVGLAAIFYWYFKKRTGIEYFIFGAIFWALAIVIKLIMDFTITGPMQSALFSSAGLVAMLVIMSLYVGLRTGLLESGITYLCVRYTKLSRIDFDRAMAIGIGFGGAEAIVLGIMSLLSVITYLAVPELIDALPAESESAVLAQFALEMIPVPVIERLFTLFCHVFATVLVVYSVKSAQLIWLGLSIAFKTLLDGVLPVSHYYLAPMQFGDYLLIEAFIVLMGLVSLWGILWIRKKFVKGGPDAYQT